MAEVISSVTYQATQTMQVKPQNKHLCIENRVQVLISLCDVYYHYSVPCELATGLSQYLMYIHWDEQDLQYVVLYVSKKLGLGTYCMFKMVDQNNF